MKLLICCTLLMAVLILLYFTSDSPIAVALINKSKDKVTLKIEENKFKEEIKKYKELDILPKSCQLLQKPSSHKSKTDCTSPVVPNIVHLVWLYESEHTFSFIALLSGLSIVRIIKPCVILFWYDGHNPIGEYWNQFTGNASQAGIPIHMLTITTPKSVGGTVFGWKEHRSSFVRMHVIQTFGGIYMDTDVLAIRSLHSLRCYNTTMGHESANAMCNDFIMAIPNAKFLKIWISQYYINYPGNYWGYNVQTAMKMAKKYPHLIHVEEKYINHPNFWKEEIRMLFDEKYKFDWSKNYVVHLWHKISKVSADPETIKHLESSFGEIARMIYYKKH